MTRILNHVDKKFLVRETWEANLSTYDKHIEAPDRLVIEDVNGVKNALFTCMPGDNLGSSGERAEIVLGGWSNSKDWVVNGSEKSVEYYRLKVKLQSPWERPDFNIYNQRWGTFFQVHGPNYFINSPALAIEAQENFSVFILGGDMMHPGSAGGGNMELTNNSLVLDKWVEFILEIKWSPYTDGYVIVYRKDENDEIFSEMGRSINRRTMQWKAQESYHPHYMKCGYYRSESNHNNTVRLGPLLRTTDRSTAFK